MFKKVYQTSIIIVHFIMKTTKTNLSEVLLNFILNKALYLTRNILIHLKLYKNWNKRSVKFKV